MEPIIEIRGLKKHFGQLEVLNDIQFSRSEEHTSELQSQR